jgi:hypothetical protein
MDEETTLNEEEIGVGAVAPDVLGDADGDDTDTTDGDADDSDTTDSDSDDTDAG